jgi:hypothetical protein
MSRVGCELLFLLLLTTLFSCSQAPSRNVIWVGWVGGRSASGETASFSLDQAASSSFFPWPTPRAATSMRAKRDVTVFALKDRVDRKRKNKGK